MEMKDNLDKFNKIISEIKHFEEPPSEKKIRSWLVKAYNMAIDDARDVLYYSRCNADVEVFEMLKKLKK